MPETTYEQPKLSAPIAVEFPAVQQAPTQILASTAALVSVFPLEKSQNTRHGTLGVFRFDMPPAAKNKIIHRRVNPMYLMGNRRPTTQDPAYFETIKDCPDGDGYVLYEVCDTQSIVKDYAQEAYIPRIVPSYDLADMLISNWTRSTISRDIGASPGIVRFRPDVPIGAQVQYAREQLTTFCVALVNDGDTLAARDDLKNITFLHRVAAEWLGVENRKWYQEMRQTRMKACPACGERILQVANKCRLCGENLHLWYAQHPEDLTEENDPILYAYFQTKKLVPEGAEGSSISAATALAREAATKAKASRPAAT